MCSINVEKLSRETVRRLRPASSSLGKSSPKSQPLHLGKVGLKSGSCDTPGQQLSSGVPMVRKMRNSWSISESPGNSARPLTCRSRNGNGEVRLG